MRQEICMAQKICCNNFSKFLQGISGAIKLGLVWKHSHLVQTECIFRSGWERHAIILTNTCLHFIKNTQVCHTAKTMCFPLFLIHSFSTLLITLFTITLIKMLSKICLYSTFYLLCSFLKLLLFFHVLVVC